MNKAGTDTYELNTLINVENLECLNQENANGILTLLPKPIKKSSLLRSDCDAQLLINIPFKSQVQLTGIVISGPTTNGTMIVQPRVGKFCKTLPDLTEPNPSASQGEVLKL